MACQDLVVLLQTLDELVNSHKMRGQRCLAFEVNGLVLLRLHGTNTSDVVMERIGFKMLKEFKRSDAQEPIVFVVECFKCIRWYTLDY